MGLSVNTDMVMAAMEATVEATDQWDFQAHPNKYQTKSTSKN
jgi:hypothetical protein